MAKNQYVVKYSPATDLYLVTFMENQNGQWETTWGSPEQAMTWNTLSDCQSVATLINGGSIGTTKPQS